MKQQCQSTTALRSAWVPNFWLVEIFKVNVHQKVDISVENCRSGTFQLIQIVSAQWTVGGPQPERVGSTNAQLSEIWNVNTVWTCRLSRWFSCFMASAVCLQYVTSSVFGVHSFQGKQLSFSRHISQCILSVIHDAMYQDFTVTCTSCSQSFHVLLFEFILLLIWWFKRLSSLSAVIRQLEERVSSWLATIFLLKICMTSSPAPSFKMA